MRFNLMFASAWPLLSLGPAAAAAAHLTNYEQISNVLSLHSIAIDSKDFSRLAGVFTPDAFANYSGANSNLTGLAEIEARLQAELASVVTQHLTATVEISMTNATNANCTSYGQATLFSVPITPGGAVTVFGTYYDQLIRGPDGWRITHRVYVPVGGPVGNSTVL